MSSAPKPAKRTRAQLERQVLELEAQIASRYHHANVSIDKCSTEHMMASGVLVQLTALGGRELVPSFVVRDGLSHATITALRADIVRSHELATIHRPKPL